MRKLRHVFFKCFAVRSIPAKPAFEIASIKASAPHSLARARSDVLDLRIGDFEPGESPLTFWNRQRGQVETASNSGQLAAILKRHLRAVADGSPGNRRFKGLWMRIAFLCTNAARGYESMEIACFVSRSHPIESSTRRIPADRRPGNRHLRCC